MRPRYWKGDRAASAALSERNRHIATRVRMKRRIVAAGVGVAMVLAGCTAPVERSRGEEAPQDGGWAAAPRIGAVVRQGAGLVIRGDAPPSLSRRLSPGPALDSVDGDGRGLVAAGRARPGSRVSVSADGGSVVEAIANAEGRWVAALPNVGDRRVDIVAGGAAFTYPGPAGGEASGQIERTDGGWRLSRLLSASARQTSWFPDADHR